MPPFWRAPSLAPRQHCPAALSTVALVTQRRQREAGDAHRTPFPTGGYAPPCKDIHALPATRRAPASSLLSQGLPGRLLIGTKLDTDQTLIETAGLEQLCQECLCRGYFPTSAKVPRGIEALHAAMAQAMDWSKLAKTTRPRFFQRIREALNERQQRDDVVLLYAALYRTGKADMRIRAKRVRSRRSQHRGRAVAAQCVPLLFAETRLHFLALHSA